MFNSGILDVAISLIFIYLLLSLVCTAINEAIEGYLKKRSATLEEGIRELLNDSDGTGLAKAVYNHPLIYSLFRGEYQPKVTKKNLPSYIPTKNFAAALTNIILTDCNAPDSSIASLKQAIANMPEGKAKGALAALVEDAGDNINKARKNIEDWYDSGMDRVSGWYKRHVQKITLAVAFLSAIIINVDTINIATRISYDATMRESLVAAATEYAKAGSTGQSASLQTVALAPGDCTTMDTPECRVQRNLDQIKKLGLPIGWQKDALPDPITFSYIISKILGLALTAFAVSLGAPFWFDMLNKVMVIRSTVKPHEKSPEEPAVDREKENRLVLSLDQGEKPSS